MTEQAPRRGPSHWQFGIALVLTFVVGVVAGGFFMYTSMRAAMPVALEAQSQAIAQERGRQAAEDRHTLATENPSNSSTTAP